MTNKTPRNWTVEQFIDWLDTLDARSLASWRLMWQLLTPLYGSKEAAMLARDIIRNPQGDITPADTPCDCEACKLARTLVH